jgi:hypothetical protein
MDGDELAQLRAEVSALRGQLDRRHRRGLALTSLRRVAAAVLVALAGFCAACAMVGVWAANTTLNTDRWVRTVAELPKDPRVSAAVAEYASTEVFGLLRAEDRLRTVLPPQAAFVAGPISTQLQTYVRQTVGTVLRSDRFQRVWIELNRRAHRQMVAIVRQSSDVVSASGQRVSVDLLPLINQALRGLEAQLPTLFGRQLNLPDITSGAIPDNLRAKVQDALGITLPANFAQFTLYDGGRLHALQAAVLRFQRAVAVLVTGTVVLTALAIWVSPHRRRTVLQLGLWLVIATMVVTASLRGVRGELLSRVPAGSYRDGVDSALTTVFAGLRTRGQQLLWLGVLLAAVCYLIGPGRVPVWLRQHVERAVRMGSARGPQWIHDHLDPLRIAGLVLAVPAALLLSSWTGLLIVAVLLASYEAAVTLVARTFAQNRAGDSPGVPPTPTPATTTGPSDR